MGITENAAMVGDDALIAATGRGAEEWFALLDAQNATTWTHTKIARWVYSGGDITGWWSQSVTIRYEQARGMREPGQKADGTFSAVSTRTLPGSPAELLELATGVLRERMGGEPASTNPTAKRPNARWNLAGRERLLLSIDPGQPGRASVGLTHSGIPDSDGIADAKTTLADLLDAIAAGVGREGP
jgi:hypothetical protein